MKKDEKILLIGAAAVAAYFVYQSMVNSGAIGGSPATAAEEAESAANTLSADMGEIGRAHV